MTVNQALERLTADAAIAVVTSLVELLYLDTDHGDLIWNPDKDWDLDFFDELAIQLQSLDLVPTEPQPYDQDDQDDQEYDHDDAL